MRKLVLVLVLIVLAGCACGCLCGCAGKCKLSASADFEAGTDKGDTGLAASAAFPPLAGAAVAAEILRPSRSADTPEGE